MLRLSVDLVVDNDVDCLDEELRVATLSITFDRLLLMLTDWLVDVRSMLSISGEACSGYLLSLSVYANSGYCSTSITDTG